MSQGFYLFFHQPACVVFNGKTAAFQAEVTGSNPVTRTYEISDFASERLLPRSKR